MTLRFSSRLVALVAVALLGACTCHTEVAQPQGAVKGPAPAAREPAKPTAPSAKTPPPSVDAAPAKIDAPPAAPAAGEPVVDPADPLGKRFIDPGWFRKDMLDGAKAMDVSRTERNENGLFSSQILFELAAGTTAEQCAEQLEAKVKGEVSNLERSPDAKAPGRLKISGSTPRYRVTMMCGEAKGVMRAYVGFEWTS